MKDALIVSVLSVIPRKRGARTMGWLARSRVSRLMTRAFVRAYKVDLSEAKGTLEDYPTLEALFTRELKDGARPVDTTPGTVVSPVDGRVAFAGRTQRGCLDVAPGKELAVSELIGEPLSGERDVAVLYLSPRDYHRVHVPVDGQAVRWRYIPGTLWPVFPAAVRRVKRLFARNERVTVRMKTANGPMDVVLVGAFGVGRITVTFTDLITNTGGRPAAAEMPPQRLNRGEPLGVFHLGSTVVLVAPPGRWRWTVTAGESIRVGGRIGERVPVLRSSTPQQVMPPSTTTD